MAMMEYKHFLSYHPDTLVKAKEYLKMNGYEINHPIDIVSLLNSANSVYNKNNPEVNKAYKNFIGKLN